jgi:L-amino acid N-acyltransferase YncA
MTPAIRFATKADGVALAAIYAPIVRDTFVSFETEAPSPDEMSARIEAGGNRYPWLAAATGDEIVGYAYAGQHRARPAYRWSVDVSAYLAPEARRRGIGRALYQRLLGVLRHQGFRTAFAGIALPNAASVGLHEHMGFEPVGVYREVGYKAGAWRDVGWWRLALSSATGEPADPIPFTRLAED